jgi:hypothetical protein
LRRASISWPECAILLLERGFQPALHIQQNPPLVGVSSYRMQHELMINSELVVLVEAEIQVERTISAPLPAALAASPPGAVEEGSDIKIRLITQSLLQHRSRQTPTAWSAERPGR